MILSNTPKLKFYSVVDIVLVMTDREASSLTILI